MTFTTITMQVQTLYIGITNNFYAKETTRRSLPVENKIKGVGQKYAENRKQRKRKRAGR